MNKLYIFPLWIFLSCFLLSNYLTFGQEPIWVWAKSPTGVNDNAYECTISTDLQGNVYVGGCFYSLTVTFGSFTLTSPANGNEHLFLVKYDPSGNVLWASGAVCTYSNGITSLAMDAAGNIYIAGYYDSDITFGSFTLQNAGSHDVFLVKYDPNGNVIWAGRAGGNDCDAAESVAVGASGDIYITGFFASSSITFGSVTLTNTEDGYDIFIAKYDANGNVTWAKSGGGIYDDYGRGVDTDPSGNVYITGEFHSMTMTIGPYTLTNQNVTPGFDRSDMFIAKYDANGNVLWAKSAGGNQSETVNSLSVDTAGNVFLPGNYFGDTITLGSSTFTNMNPQSTNIFLAKYSTDGDILWAVGAGGPNDDGITSVSTDNHGNVYLARYSDSPSITFGSYTLPNPDSWLSNLFVTSVKLNIK